MNIKVTVSSSGMSIKDLKQRIQDRVPEFLERMAADADSKATEYFERAVYAGRNDVKVSHKMIGKKKARVRADGRKILFIEYGTGLGPVEAPYTAGSYGKGQGAHPPWAYYGEIGNSPDSLIVRTTKKRQVVLTYGNPANLCMHGARENVIQEAGRIAKEVFR